MPVTRSAQKNFEVYNVKLVEFKERIEALDDFEIELNERIEALVGFEIEFQKCIDELSKEFQAAKASEEEVLAREKKYEELCRLAEELENKFQECKRLSQKL